MKIQSLKFEDVRFQFEGHDPLLNHVNFEFPMNEIVFFKATEGAGKSTLLQILAALLPLNSGKYYINDQDTSQMSFEEFLPYRLKIGYSFDYGGLINNRNLSDNLMLPLLYHKMASPEEAKERVDSLFRRFDILKFAHERPAHVPGRVRKLACLLRALVIQPEVLLMDDPSIGLGQETVLKFFDMIHELRQQGFASHIFMTSYDEKFINLFESRFIYMSDGNLFLETPQQEKRVVSL